MPLVYDSGSICPQHWRNGGWMKTGDINPLPIETFIYNGTTWVPVSTTNPLPVTTANSTVNVNNAASSPVPVSFQIINNPSTAPTLSASGTGNTLPAGTYYVKYTWVSPYGESLPSPEASQAVTAGQALNITLPSFPVGVTSANIYVSTSSGAETKQLNTTSTTASITAPLVAGSAMPTVSTVNPSMPISIATSSVMVPVDIQNAQVAASRVTLMAANAIRDTNNYYAANIDWTGYRRYCLRAQNLLNQPVTLAVQVQNIGDYRKIDGSIMSVTIPANTDNVLITANELPILGQPIGEQIAFRIQATTAPTSGTFTLYAYVCPM